MGSAGGDALGAANLHQSLGRVTQGTASIHHVVQKNDPLVPHVADDVHHLGGVGLLPPLVHNGQGHVQLLGKGPGPGHRPHIGGDHHGLVLLVLIFAVEVIHKDGGTQHVVHRDIKEALNLIGVEVHREDPVGAGGGNQVGHQLGGDGVPGLGLAVLPGVAEIGDHCGDPAGGGPFQGVYDDKQFHQRVVDGADLPVLGKGAGGLDHEYIRTPDRLIDGDEVLPVGESPHLGVAQRDAQFLADVRGQRGVRVAGDDLDVFAVCDHTFSSSHV